MLVLVVAAPAASAREVDLGFTAVHGVGTVACDRALGEFGGTLETAELRDLRFLVSDARLLRKGGRAVPVRLTPGPFQAVKGRHGATLIDLEDGGGACTAGDPATNLAVRGTVPKGRYTGVRFTVGLPAALARSEVGTVLDGAAARIVFGQPAGADPEWAAPVFPIALQRTATITLKRLDPRRQQAALDVDALVGNTNVSVNAEGQAGCQSDPTDDEDCEPVFAALGLSGAPQTAFRPVPR